MKLRFYVDIWPGAVTSNGMYAMTNPTAKAVGAKRLAFDVAIPDALIYEHDAVSPEVSKAEMVPDHSEQTS